MRRFDICQNCREFRDIKVVSGGSFYCLRAWTNEYQMILPKEKYEKRDVPSNCWFEFEQMILNQNE